MDTLELIEKLKIILAQSEKEAVSLLDTSILPIDERFQASAVLERSVLRMSLIQLVTDLEALD